MRARIGITTGDPAGIGLEIFFKSIPSLLSSARYVLFTDRYVFQRNLDRFKPPLNYRWIDSASGITDEAVLFAVDVGGGSSDIEWGRISSHAGESSFRYLEAASAAALRGDIQAIVTAPVNKEAIGRDFKGQTEFLAGRADCKKFAMAFFSPTLKVVLATIHMPLKDAISSISTPSYVQLIRFIHAEFGRLKFPPQRIAVAAINPHAGENGMFGHEDDVVLAPAVQQCAAEGILVSGPHSADSLYYRAHSGEFDVIVAPYHDQGLIPVKLIAHGAAANITLGLPYIRTSPDHGPAFPIAGQGCADASGMENAIRCALDLIERNT